jgi:hypothetical protein
MLKDSLTRYLKSSNFAFRRFNRGFWRENNSCTNFNSLKPVCLLKITDLKSYRYSVKYTAIFIETVPLSEIYLFVAPAPYAGNISENSRRTFF